MSDSLPTLQYWLDRMRQGDANARNELIRHSRERFHLLTRPIRRYPGLREWEEASDVLQGASLRLYNALLAVDVPTPLDFISLATALIRRELIDLMRRHFGPLGAGTHQPPPGRIDDALSDPADQDGGRANSPCGSNSTSIWRAFPRTSASSGMPSTTRG